MSARSFPILVVLGPLLIGPLLIGPAPAAGLQGPQGLGRFLPQPSVPAPPPPAPMPPPVASAPAVSPPAGVSPLLLQPGPVLPPPTPRASPSYPSSTVPGAVDQQKERAYRDELLGRQRQIDRGGVSPADPRYRELQQQFQQTR